MEEIEQMIDVINDGRCRMCLECTEVEINLYDVANPKEEELTYWDILLDFCSIKTPNCTNTPQKICTKCAKEAETCYGFKLLCENSDITLKEELTPDFSDEDLTEDIKIHHEDILLNKIDNETDSAMNYENIEDVDNETNSISEYNKLISGSYKDDDNKIDNLCEEIELISSSDEDDHKKIQSAYKKTEQNQILSDFERIRLSRAQQKMCKCQYCGFTFHSLEIKSHYVKKHLEKRIGCNICEEDYYDPAWLLKHVKNNHKSEKTFNCSLCEFQTPAYELYYEHMMEKHREYFSELKCSYCDYRTVSKICLGKHMSLNHEEQKPEQCELCDKAFFDKRGLRKHLKTHTEKNRVVCEICGKSYKSPRDLKNHMDGHTNNKTFECTICLRTFNQLNLYQAHKRNHRIERKFKCERCGLLFKRKPELNKHVKFVHLKIKTKECEVCNKWFPTAYSLKKHLMRHAGNREIECEVCGSRFYKASELKQHMVVHTGEKRWVCDVCGKGFTAAHTLRIHSKTHNKMTG